MANEALAVQQRGELLSDEVLSPVMNLAVAKKRLAEFREFVKEYLVENEDFGTIPGTPKPTLYKPGADKLCELYGLADSYEIVDKIEDWGANPPLFDYTVRCTLIRIRTQVAVSSGLGCCSTYESKYRWRRGQLTCPDCGVAAVIKGKAEYGGGFICFKAKNGCGKKFESDDPAITSQKLGRVENEDIIDQKNTALKMAKKRAKIDATLSATRSSGVFTQDIEDMADVGDDGPPQGAQRGRGAPVKRAGTRPAARQHEDNIDVKCAQCGAINSHAPDCPAKQKPQGQTQGQPAGQKQAQAQQNQAETQGQPQGEVQPPKTKPGRLIFVNDVKHEISKKTKKPYLELVCTDREERALTVYVYHATPMKHADTWKNKWCLMALSEKPSADGQRKFLSLEEIQKCENVEYSGNEPILDGDAGPEEEKDLGFDPQ